MIDAARASAALVGKRLDELEVDDRGRVTLRFSSGDELQFDSSWSDDHELVATLNGEPL